MTQVVRSSVPREPNSAEHVRDVRIKRETRISV